MQLLRVGLGKPKRIPFRAESIVIEPATPPKWHAPYQKSLVPEIEQAGVVVAIDDDLIELPPRVGLVADRNLL